MQRRAKIMTIQLYRLQPGDVGIGDIPAEREIDLTSAKKTAADALTSYFNDPNRPSPRKPHHARLLAEDGSTVAELEMRLDGIWEVPARA
jgi:hypothetical protein